MNKPPSDPVLPAFPVVGGGGPVHKIAAVGTSVVAFVGWAAKGPTTEAVPVSSWVDFQAQFGGLSASNGVPNYLGYAVLQYFQNGGQQALIVRIVWDGSLTWTGSPPPAQLASTASATAVGGAFTLYASSPGSWGNSLSVKVIMEPSPSVRFAVQVLEANSGLLENFASLSVSPADPRYAVAVIDGESSNVTFANPALPPNSPIGAPSQPTATPAAGAPLAGGLDGPVLVPGDVNFETALGAANAARSNRDFGVSLLNAATGFNLLCVPGETDEATIRRLQKYCVGKRAFYIVDCPQLVTRDDLYTGKLGTSPGGSTPGSLTGRDSKNSAYYYPWVLAPDPLAGDSPGLFPPCGFVAGIYAATDSQKGVWTSPAGIGASVAGAVGLHEDLTDVETADLSAAAINCLRNFSAYGNVVWGARTLAGGELNSSQWRYIPIRRLALLIEASIYEGIQWVVFEPNNPVLWAELTASVGAFMQELFQLGSLQGTSPQQAYFVTCDSENNTPSSIDLGIVNITIGFAPVYPAEFIIIQISQLAGP